MRTVISRFQRRIGELEQFDPATVQNRSDPRIRAPEIAIDEALSETFGQETPEYFRYVSAANLDRAGLNYAYETPLHEVIDGLILGKEQAIALLNQAIRSLEEKLADLGDTVVAGPPGGARSEVSESTRAKPPRDVFIVHGRDDPAKVELARLIERAGLNAVILHEQPPHNHREVRRSWQRGLFCRGRLDSG
jgi:hypothetical protein